MNTNYSREPVKKKQFLIIRKGASHVLLKISDIAYIFMKDDITYIVDYIGEKRLCFENLNSLEEQLDENFFRANRQNIINVGFISSYQIGDMGKMSVELKIKDKRIPIHISQKTAPKFRDWILRF